VTLRPSRAIVAGSTISISGLTGTATSDAASLQLSGANASKFVVSGTTSRGVWTRSTGKLELTVNAGQNIPTDSDTVFTFNVTNPANVQTSAINQTLTVSAICAEHALTCASAIAAQTCASDYQKADDG
jgi:hypothetical protein